MRRLAITLACVCAPAFAQNQPQQAAQPEQPVAEQPSAAAGGSGRLFTYDDGEAQRLFRELDRNGDGYLSAEELAAERSNQGNWAAVDRDGDGRISVKEFTVIKPR
jgi:hypothetical protein